MIVEDQVDRRVGWVGLIEELEELDELAAAVAILDQGVHLAGQQIDAGQQADRAVALVFMVACEGRMHAGFGGQIGRRRCDRLDTGRLVVGDDRHPVARLRLRQGRSLLEDFDLAINAQHFGHLFPQTRDRGTPGSTAPCAVCLHLLLVESILHTVPCAKLARHACPCAGPCSRAWRARSRVVHNSCG